MRDQKYYARLSQIRSKYGYQHDQPPTTYNKFTQKDCSTERTKLDYSYNLNKKNTPVIQTPRDNYSPIRNGYKFETPRQQKSMFNKTANPEQRNYKEDYNHSAWNERTDRNIGNELSVRTPYTQNYNLNSNIHSMDLNSSPIKKLNLELIKSSPDAKDNLFQFDRNHSYKNVSPLKSTNRTNQMRNYDKLQSNSQFKYKEYERPSEKFQLKQKYPERSYSKYDRNSKLPQRPLQMPQYPTRRQQKPKDIKLGNKENGKGYISQDKNQYLGNEGYMEKYSNNIKNIQKIQQRIQAVLQRQAR